jgi:hypothetical protein
MRKAGAPMIVIVVPSEAACGSASERMRASASVGARYFIKEKARQGAWG